MWDPPILQVLSIWRLMLCRDDPWDAAAGHSWLPSGDQIWTGDTVQIQVQDPVEHQYPDSTCSGRRRPPTLYRARSCRMDSGATGLDTHVHLYRMKTSPIWYPDNVIIFVLIEPSATYGLFNPELQQRHMNFSTGSHICFVVVVTGPANKLGAEFAIMIIAENISFSLGCWSDCCNNRILITAPDHLRLTGTQTGTQGSEKSLRHILTDAFLHNNRAAKHNSVRTRAQSQTEQQQQMGMSSKHRCFLSALGWSPLSVQSATRPIWPRSPETLEEVISHQSLFIQEAEKNPIIAFCRWWSFLFILCANLYFNVP